MYRATDSMGVRGGGSIPVRGVGPHLGCGHWMRFGFAVVRGCCCSSPSSSAPKVVAVDKLLAAGCLVFEWDRAANLAEVFWSDWSKTGVSEACYSRGHCWVFDWDSCWVCDLLWVWKIWWSEGFDDPSDLGGKGGCH